MKVQRLILVWLMSVVIVAAQGVEVFAYSHNFLSAVSHLRKKNALTKRPATASLEKPRVIEVLRGKVVDIEAKKIIVDESYTGRMRIVHLPESVFADDIKKGDLIRVNFVKGSRKALDIVKE